jgi:YHS domain-containing protein
VISAVVGSSPIGHPIFSGPEVQAKYRQPLTGLLSQSIHARFPMPARPRFVLALLGLMFASQLAFGGEFFEVDGVALRGYDPVAYFEVGQPTPGLPAFSHTYKGSDFHFASGANLKKFVADPDKYAPQFGGFCALGTANGYKVKTEPDAFKVVDGKLYLNYNRKVLEMWTQDEPGYIARANKNWPEVSRMPIKE